MPSVFSGMDPFIEGYEWEDFHVNMISEIQALLVPHLRPEYVVRTERRIYVEHAIDNPQLIRPDLTILRGCEQVSNATTATHVTLLEPVERTLPKPQRIEEKYLVIRRLNSPEVITVIELLSPSNKRAKSQGRKEYLSKREEILQSKTHLVELDLLRGGERLPTVEPLPDGDYYALVCRAQRRYTVSVYTWRLEHRLPIIPIPLAIGDREISLDLQAAFDSVFDRAGYDYSIDYSHPVVPTVNESQQQWIAKKLDRKAIGG